MADTNYAVIIHRKDEPGFIRWTDAPVTLTQAMRAAEEFLHIQTGRYRYSEQDITIHHDVNESIRLSLNKARALSRHNHPSCLEQEGLPIAE